MPRTTLLTIGCLLFCAGLLAAGLWPFNFRVENNARLAPDAGGLHFEAPASRSKSDLGGMVFTPTPIGCRPQDRCEPGRLTLAIRLRAANESNTGLKRIVELHRPGGGAAFYLAQWKSALIVRVFDAAPGDRRPYREMGIGGALAAGRTSLVPILSGPQGTDFFLDGRPAKSYPAMRLLRDDETLEGLMLYLGNSPDLSGPWSGQVAGLALFGSVGGPGAGFHDPGSAGERLLRCEGGPPAALACFRFDRREGAAAADLSGSGNHLRIPAQLVFDKRLLGLPDGRYFSRSDLAVNIAGFVPFGFLVCLRLLLGGRCPLRAGILIAVAAGVAVSLVIETTQVWLPGRDSSLLDLGANALGAALGALLCAAWRGKLLKSS
ncbi:MAG: VanZ family protein [Desulfobacteraceae bacterium]|nr:MAG: VanZ family protein [Desulfobacteraceae bacterium]